MKRFLVLSILIGFFSFVFPNNIKLELVKTIGDDRDDYTFYKIRDAVIYWDSVYITDQKGYFIAKYTLDGKFVKRVGQKGQGPGDFGGPSKIFIKDQYVYIHDNHNQRIVKMDQDLEIYEYIKLQNNFFNDLFVIGNSIN